MQVTRRILDGTKYLLLTPTKEESRIIDEVFGASVDNDGFIAAVEGQVRLSTDCSDHYLLLGKKEK